MKLLKRGQVGQGILGAFVLVVVILLMGAFVLVASGAGFLSSYFGGEEVEGVNLERVEAEVLASLFLNDVVEVDGGEKRIGEVLHEIGELEVIYGERLSRAAVIEDRWEDYSCEGVNRMRIDFYGDVGFSIDKSDGESIGFYRIGLKRSDSVFEEYGYILVRGDARC